MRLSCHKLQLYFWLDLSGDADSASYLSSAKVDQITVFMVFPEKHDSSSPTRRMSESGGVLNFGKPPRSILYFPLDWECTVLCDSSSPLSNVRIRGSVRIRCKWKLPLLLQRAKLPKEHGLSSMSHELVWPLIT